MSLFGYTAALAYPVGNWVLWHLVELERVLLPDEAYGDPEPLPRRPAPEQLTPLGWRRWRVARAFTRLGGAAWLVGGALWLVW